MKEAKEIIDLLNNLTPLQHAEVFKEIKTFTKDRFTKLAEDTAELSKQASGFIQEHLK